MHTNDQMREWARAALRSFVLRVAKALPAEHKAAAARLRRWCR
jgi:hypothetical protein